VALSRPRSRRIGVLVPENVHSCYFALVWSTHELSGNSPEKLSLISHLVKVTAGVGLGFEISAQKPVVVQRTKNTKRLVWRRL